MTLSGRNNFFRAGIIFCAICSLLALAASFPALSAYPMMEENAFRPATFFQNLISRFLEVDYFAVHISLFAAVMYSLAAIIMIYYSFRQTQSSEIVYIAIFALSFSFEVIRFIIPLQLVYGISSFYTMMAFRILLFGRYVGIFSIFAASVCSAGIDGSKARNFFIIIIGSALAIALRMPIDTQTWNTSLSMINSYTSLFRVIEVITVLSAVISFFIAVSVRSSKDYTWIGFGAMFAMIGRNILLYSDNWVSPIIGILMLSAGTWLICSRLHKIYLWL